jgi:hypothetical protein
MDRAMALAVAIALGYLAFAAWRYRRRSRGGGPLDRPVSLPEAMPVLAMADTGVLLPGAVWPYELRGPESQALVLEAHERSRVIGIAPAVPAGGQIVCAARVIEARRDGDKVGAVVQGVARVRLLAERPSGEWSIALIADSEEAKGHARLAAERIRQLALRVIDRQQVPPGTDEFLQKADPSELMDLAASVCDLPREAQAAVLATEDLSARSSVVLRALEARARR